MKKRKRSRNNQQQLWDRETAAKMEKQHELDRLVEFCFVESSPERCWICKKPDDSCKCGEFRYGVRVR